MNRSLRTVSAFIVVAAALAACSSDSTTTSASGGSASIVVSVPPTSPMSPTADLCSSVTDLYNSLQAVKQVDVVAQGTDALKAALTDVESKLVAVKSAAGTTFSAEVDAIKAAADSLKSSADEVTSGTPLKEELPAIATGIAALTAATDQLATTAKSQNCDLPSAGIGG